MSRDWRKLLTSENKLQPSHRRHVFRYCDYVVKLALEPNERDYMGNLHDPTPTALADENDLRAIELARKYTTVPVPEVLESGPGLTVYKYLDGISLEDAWKNLTPNQLNHILCQLRGYIGQLQTIPNPYTEFEVGTLCSTHHFFRVDCGCEAGFNGPFKTTQEYRRNVKRMFDREPHFPVDAKPVFDHMNWFRCNVMLTPNLDSISAIIDWEYAGFIPDPKDEFIGDLPIQEWHHPEWATIFDGVGG